MKIRKLHERDFFVWSCVSYACMQESPKLQVILERDWITIHTC